MEIAHIVACSCLVCSQKLPGQACMCWHRFTLLDFPEITNFFEQVNKCVCGVYANPLAFQQEVQHRTQPFQGCCFACRISSIPHEPSFLLTVSGIYLTLILALPPRWISLGFGHNECLIHKTTNTVKRGRGGGGAQKVSLPKMFLISKQL